MNPAATTIALDVIELGADALMGAAPGLTRHEAVAMAAVTLAATFPECAAIVAEQAYGRAVEHRGGDPVAAVGQYAIELRMQAQEEAAL